MYRNVYIYLQCKQKSNNSNNYNVDTNANFWHTRKSEHRKKKNIIKG